MANNYQVIVDFLLKFQNDPQALNRIVADTEKVLSGLSPDIKFDAEVFKNELKIIGDMLNNTSFDINTVDAQKSLTEVMKTVQQINQLDTSEFEAAFANFEESLNNLSDDELLAVQNALEGISKDFDTDKVQQEIDEMVTAFVKSKRETEQLIEKNKLALQAMEANGKKGSDAYNAIEKEVKEAEVALAKFNGTADKSGKTFGGKMATFGLAVDGVQKMTAAFDQFLGPYMEFDKQLKNIGTLGVKNFEEFRNAAIDLASGVPDTVAGVTEGIYNAISAGAIQVVDGVADIGEGMKFVEQASKLAVAGMTDTNSAIKGLASVTNAYGSEMLNAGDAADILFGIVKSGVTTVPELNAALSNVVPIAAAAGVEFDQVGAAIATLTKQGVPTAQATTQIRSAIAELLKPGANLKKVMDEAGVSIETLKQDGLVTTMSKLGGAMETLGIDAANTFSSIESIGFALATTGKNSDKFANDLVSIQASAGSVQEAFTIANEGIGVQVQSVLNQIEAGFFKIFGSMGDGFTALLATSNKVAPIIATFSGLKNIVPRALIGQITTLSATLGGGFVKSMGLATGSVKAFTVSLMTNPVVLMAAALAGLIVTTKLLSDAFHESAAEKLEAAQQEKNIVEEQIKTTQKQVELAERNKKLVENFKELGEDAMANKDLIVALTKAYPGAIDMTKSYSDNLINLQFETQKSTDELGTFQDKIADLELKKLDLEIKTFKLEAATVKEQMEDTLTTALVDDTSWLNPFQKLGGYVQEFLFGSSEARWQAEESVKEFTDQIYKASTADEVNKASIAFMNAIYDGDEFASLSDEMKSKMLQDIDVMSAKRVETIEAESRLQTDGAKALLQQSIPYEKVVDMISVKYKKSKEEAEKIVKATQEELKLAKEKDVLLSKEEERRNKIGTLVSQQLNESQAKYNQGIDEAATISLKMTEERKKGNIEAVKYLDEEYKKTVRNNDQEAKNIKVLQLAIDKEKKRYETRPAKNWLEVVREIVATNERDLLFAEKLFSLEVKRWAVLEGRDTTEFDNYQIALKNLETRRAINAEWVAELEARGKIKKNDSELGYEISTSLSKDDRRTLEEMLRQQKIDIETSELAVLQYSLDIETLQKELAESVNAFNAENVKLQIEAETISEGDFEQYLKSIKAQRESLVMQIKDANSRIESLENEKNEKITALGLEATDEQIAAVQRGYDLRIVALRQHALTLVETEKDVSANVSETLNSYYNTRLQRILSGLDAEGQAVENKYKEYNEKLAKLTTEFLAAEAEAIGESQSKLISRLDAEKAEKLKALDEQGRLMLASTESIEAQKAKVEADYQRKRIEQEKEFNNKRLASEGLARGMETELQRQQLLETSEIQRRRLEAEISSIQARINAGEQLSPAELIRLDELQNKMVEVTNTITENGSMWNSAFTILGQDLSSSITALFAGNSKAASDGLKKMFSSVLGIFANYLSAYIEGVVLKLVLDWFNITDGQNPLVKLLIAPLISATIGSGVRALANPVISSLLNLASFSTGGRIDGPTLAVIGDGSKLGDRNREWVFNDTQLKEVVAMSSAASTRALAGKLDALISIMSSQRLEAKLEGRDLRVALRREDIAFAGRSI